MSFTISSNPGAVEKSSRGRREKLLVLDPEPVMDAQALLDDLEREVRCIALARRISAVRCSLRDSIASRERIA
jgi:hypothetical protein